MKLNFDAMRDLLFVIETQPRIVDINEVICDIKLTQYDQNELGYALEKLIESGLLNGTVNSTKDGIYFIIDSISYVGHQFLDHVRDDTLWNKTKASAAKLGIKGASGLISIAAQVFSNYLSHNLNL